MIEKSKFRIPRVFLFCGLVCFLASLALPSIQLPVLGSPAIFCGAQVAIWAIWLGFEIIVHGLTFGEFENIGYVIFGVASALNVIFLVAPALQISSQPKQRVLWCIGIVSLLGLLLGIIAPSALEGVHPVKLVGYFVWLVGYGFITGSLALALIESKKSQ